MPNPNLSISQHYHQQTKYSPETIKQQAGPLDWDNQPVPFKDYKIGLEYALKPYLEEDKESGSGSIHDLDAKIQQQRKRLSRLLLCSYGLTVKIITQTGDTVFFRSAPSAGALYPAEVYLVSRGTDVLAPGLYYYQPKGHRLIQFWDSNVWQSLQEACFWHPSLDHTQFALVTTAVYGRSVWRYRARAYRRILLDTGHLLGNIELACAINQYRPHLIGGFADEALNQMLYLDPDQEGGLAVMALADLLEVQQNLPLYPTALGSAVHPADEAIAPHQLLPNLHEASSISPTQNVNWKTIKISNPLAQDGPSQKEAERPSSSLPENEASSSAKTSDGKSLDKYNFPFCLKVETAIEPAIDWDVELLGLEATILKRRSTRSYSGSNLSLEDVKRLLDFTYQPHHYPPQGLDRSPDYFDLSLIETFIVVSGVDDLDEGCYYYAPHAQELRQIRFRNFRRDLHFLCLKQDLGRDAAVVVFHTADLKKAIHRYGDRAYRYLHMDAGHLGQRMNLAAIRLGLGVSGIAGFFDDSVNEVLGIPSDEAVLYITTLGQPA
ncbi:MAG: SagB/ThcOx family dehydrogenase [Leptolyngbyaceae bacterium]|nr:SagB/ThcOx family dehydrogenase [Leptolyngbyaceae bacterium]